MMSRWNVNEMGLNWQTSVVNDVQVQISLNIKSSMMERIVRCDKGQELSASRIFHIYSALN